MDETRLKTLEAELEAAAAGAAATGGALTALQKGIQEGFASLTTLIKGFKPAAKGAPEPDGDEGAGGGGDGDGDEGAGGQGTDDDDDNENGGEAGGKGDEPDEDEDKPTPGKPGFEDMRMGGEGDDFVDVTAYVQVLEQKNERLHKAVKRQSRELAELRQDVRNLSVAVASTMGPMMKGVQGLHEALALIPGNPRAPGVDNGAAAAVRHNLATAAAAEREQIDVVKLAKGHKAKLFTEVEFASFKRTGTFSEDADRNKAIRDAIDAIK